MSTASGLVIVLLAVWIFLRTVRGTPRLANVLLGKKAANAAGGRG